MKKNWLLRVFLLFTASIQSRPPEPPLVPGAIWISLKTKMKSEKFLLYILHGENVMCINDNNSWTADSLFDINKENLYKIYKNVSGIWDSSSPCSSLWLSAWTWSKLNSLLTWYRKPQMQERQIDRAKSIKEGRTDTSGTRIGCRKEERRQRIPKNIG